MATAKKLPSGKWRVLQYDYTDAEGKRKYKSFIAETKKEAEYLASLYKMEKEDKERTGLTLDDAMERYVSMKENVLSPATVRLYKSYKQNHFHDLKQKPVEDITREDVQRFVNTELSNLHPKTVRNIHGFLSAVLTEFAPNTNLNTSLPQKKKHDVHIPSKEEVQTMLELCEQKEDKTLYLAILLASNMGLRRGEVCALDWKDVDYKKKTITIRSAITITDEHEFVEKTPKTYSGNRTVPVPDATLAELKRLSGTGKIVPLTPDQLNNRFRRFKKHYGFSDYTFHNLRHYYASVMLSIGVPDLYAMKFMGHSTTSMLKTVYQHIIDEREQECVADINQYFS